MGQAKTNNGPGGKPLHDVKIFGATIWGLRQFKKPWKDICQQIDVPISTAKRYLSQYLELIKDEPKIRDAMVTASQDIANLVAPSVKKYAELIDSKHLTLQGHGLAAARDVLKTHDLIKDKKIVEASVIQLDDDELESEYGNLVRRRRKALDRSGD